MGELNGKGHHGDLDLFSKFPTRGETEIMRSAGVIALNSGDVFTMQPVRRASWRIEDLEYAQDIARGYYNPNMPFFDMATPRVLDFEHLQNPVPASNYYDARSAECWGKQSHCVTLTDAQFRPQLSLGGKMWSSLYTWSDSECSYPLLVDPPIRLEPIPESKIRDSNHPVVTAKVFHTTSVDEGMPQPEGASWPFNPEPRLHHRQGYYAHRRPGLVPPTPLPTPRLRPPGNSQTGDSEMGTPQPCPSDGADEENYHFGLGFDKENPQITPYLRPSGGLHKGDPQVNTSHSKGTSPRGDHRDKGEARDHKASIAGSSSRDKNSSRDEQLDGFGDQPHRGEDVDGGKGRSGRLQHGGAGNPPPQKV